MNAVIALIHRPPASDLHTYDPIYKWEENPSLLTSNEQSFVYAYSPCQHLDSRYMGQHAMRVSKELVAPWLPNIGTMDAPSSCSLIYSSIVTRVASVSSHQRQASFETRRPPNPALWVISFSPKHRVINWVKKLQTSSPEKPISYCWLIYIYIYFICPL